MNIVLRVLVYYTTLVLATWLVWRMLPVVATSQLPIRELFGLEAPRIDDVSKGEIFAQAAQSSGGVRTLLATASLAMVSAFLLSLPVAWVYILTRAKRGFQQSVVQTMVILPIVVAGILVLVKHSLALAFSLGAVVAAVRFRSSLDDSKDAVYIFLAIGIGLASGVQLPIAVVLSAMFNAVILIMWYTDFGRSGADLEGDLAQRRLDSARAVANRTGAFIARLDSEVLESMSPDQLDALADRAWRRKKRQGGKGSKKDSSPTPEFSTGDGPAVTAAFESMLRVHVSDPVAARVAVDPLLTELFPRWRYGGVVHEPDGTHWLEYGVAPPEKRLPQEVLYEIRTRSNSTVLKVELV